MQFLLKKCVFILLLLFSAVVLKMTAAVLCNRSWKNRWETKHFLQLNSTLNSTGFQRSCVWCSISQNLWHFCSFVIALSKSICWRSCPQMSLMQKFNSHIDFSLRVNLWCFSKHLVRFCRVIKGPGLCSALVTTGSLWLARMVKAKYILLNNVVGLKTSSVFWLYCYNAGLWNCDTSILP